MRLYELYEAKITPQSKGITLDQIYQMAELFANGKTLRAIGKMYDITHKGVLYHLQRLANWDEINKKHREHESFIDNSSKGITSLQVQQMEKLYAEGKGFTEIGKIFNLSKNTVIHHLQNSPKWNEITKQYSINKKYLPVINIPVEKIEQMGELYASGKSLTSIGSMYGVERKLLLNRLQSLPDWEEIKQKHFSIANRE